MDSFILLFEPVMELILISFKLLLGVLLHPFQLPNIFLGIKQFLFQCINNFLMSILHGFAVMCMQHYQPVLEVLQLNIRILLNSVNLVLQYSNFIEQLFSVLFMLVSHSINLTKQIFDLIIFESNNLPQAIELN